MKADGALYCVEIGLVWRRRKHVQVFGGGIQKEIDHLKDLTVDERITMKLMLRQLGGAAWTRLIWLRTDTSSSLV